MENIIYCIILAVLFIGSAVLAVLGRKNEAALEKAKSLQATIDIQALGALLGEALPWLVTQAEKLLGTGTGAVKRAYVVQEIIKLLPESLRARLDTDKLYGTIDTVLAQLRPLWEANPAMVKQDADSETNVSLHLVTNDISTTLVDAITNDATVTISAAVESDVKAEVPGCDEYTAEGE